MKRWLGPADALTQQAAWWAVVLGAARGEVAMRSATPSPRLRATAVAALANGGGATGAERGRWG